MQDSINRLAVDTAMNGCGVGLRRADGAFFSAYEAMERGQAERLIPMILEVSAQAGLGLPDIGAYAVAAGPGSFTGLRVGLAAVRALAQGAGVPAYGVGTFDAIEDALEAGQGPACILIETKRTDYYVRAPGFDDGCVGADRLRDMIGPGWVLAGDAASRAARELNLENRVVEMTCVPTDRLIARAMAMPAPGDLPEPVYLRGADVSIPRRKPARIV